MSDQTVELPESAQLEKLLKDLPAVWAKIPADDDGATTALAFVRLAYWLGYEKALEARP